MHTESALNNMDLQFAIDSGIIDVTLVRDMVEKMKNEAYLEKHEHKIWQADNGRWYTYLPDREKGRKQVTRKTQEEIEKLVIDYYKENEFIPFFDIIFQQWVDQKLEYGEIQKQTYDRYMTDFSRFFGCKTIATKDMRKITELEIEDLIKKTIKDQELTSKAYSGMRTIIRGTFKYAKKRGYTNISVTNFFGDLELSRKAFKKVRKDDCESVFTDAEVRSIQLYADLNPSVLNYGIVLTFQTGLRVGELVALTKSDIVENILTVNKTEVRYKDENGKYIFEVRDNAKTDAGNRDVVLSTDALKTIRKIKQLNPFGRYLFEKNGRRVSEKAFMCKIYRVCDALHIRRRSMHKVRKTYATKLLNANVDERIIINQMGHTDISCTKQFYYFNNKTLNEVAEQIELAMNY